MKEKNDYKIEIRKKKNKIKSSRNSTLSLMCIPDLIILFIFAYTLAVIAVFDAICIALMHYTGYTKEQFVVIRPGGAVGYRLNSIMK